MLKVEAAIYRLIKRHGRDYWADQVIKLVIHNKPPYPDGKYLIKGGGPRVWKRFNLYCSEACRKKAARGGIEQQAENRWIVECLRRLGLVAKIWPVYTWDESPAIFALMVTPQAALNELNLYGSIATEGEEAEQALLPGPEVALPGSAVSRELTAAEGVGVELLLTETDPEKDDHLSVWMGFSGLAEGDSITGITASEPSGEGQSACRVRYSYVQEVTLIVPLPSYGQTVVIAPSTL